MDFERKPLSEPDSTQHPEWIVRKSLYWVNRCHANADSQILQPSACKVFYFKCVDVVEQAVECEVSLPRVCQRSADRDFFLTLLATAKVLAPQIHKVDKDTIHLNNGRLKVLPSLSVAFDHTEALFGRR